MERDPSLLLWDAAQSAEAILRFTAGLSFDDYAADEMVRSAVERRFEILGEALDRLRRVDPEMAGRISGLRGAIALRNLLSHGYDSVDDRTIWAIVQQDIPVTVAEIRALLG